MGVIAQSWNQQTQLSVWRDHVPPRDPKSGSASDLQTPA